MLFEFLLVLFVLCLQDSLERFVCRLLNSFEAKCLLFFLLLLNFLLSLFPSDRVFHFELHGKLDALAPIGNVAPNTVIEKRLVEVHLPLLGPHIVDQ